MRVLLLLAASLLPLALATPAAAAQPGDVQPAVAASTAVSPPSARGRAAIDTTVAWRTYSATRQARVRVYPCDDEARPHTIVIDDPAANGDEPITDEARFVAEHVGRALGIDPVAATFVFRYTPASFAPAAGERGRALLLRATFRRGDSGDLTAPTWRVLTADQLGALTDRQLR